MLEAMRDPCFSLWRVERRHETAGLILRDLLRGGEIWLVDETMEETARPGLEIAARVLKPAGFAMTARIVVPVVPNLMDEAYTRAPASRHVRAMSWPATRASLSPSAAPPSPLASWMPSVNQR